MSEAVQGAQRGRVLPRDTPAPPQKGSVEERNQGHRQHEEQQSHLRWHQRRAIQNLNLNAFQRVDGLMHRAMLGDAQQRLFAGLAIGMR